MLYTSLVGKVDPKLSKLDKLGVTGDLIKCGFIHKRSDGFYVLMPLGWRIVKKLKQIITKELEAFDGQEFNLPAISDINLLKQSGREEVLKSSMISYVDEKGATRILSSFHEEMVTSLLSNYLNSSSELPVVLFQYKTKFRDSKVGEVYLVHAKEYIVADTFSFHSSYTDLNNFFPKMHRCFSNIFKKIDLGTFNYATNVSKTGGEKAIGFAVESKIGSDKVLTCTQCDYTALKEVAIGVKEPRLENPLPTVVEIASNLKTVEDIADHFKVDLNRVCNCEIYKTNTGFVMTVVRGDYKISVEKLSRVINTIVERLATTSEIVELGFYENNFSPCDLPIKIPVIIDDAVENSSNLVISGNQEGQYLINANFGLDFESEVVTDISRCNRVNRCRICGSEYDYKKIIEVAKLINISNVFSRKIGLKTDVRGKEVNPYMGTYSIGLERVLLSLAETHSDESGFLWPESVAPFKYHLMNVGKSPRTAKITEDIYKLIARNCLYDNRSCTVEQKETLSKLLGMPYIISVTDVLAHDKKIEVENRITGEIIDLPFDCFKEYILEGETGNWTF